MIGYFSKADIRTLQRNLNRLGYNAGKVDGELGINTETALSNYLADNGYALADASAAVSKLSQQTEDQVLTNNVAYLSDDEAGIKARQADMAGVRAKKNFSPEKPSAIQTCPKKSKCPQSGKLGNLSANYESGSRGSTAIGYDRTGGWSYGKYQIETKKGTMPDFLKHLKTVSPDIYEQLDTAGGYEAARAGSKQFKTAWKTAAKAPDFEALQHDYIAAKNYFPLGDRIRRHTGIDVTQRSAAVQDVVWSVAVQHGPDSSVIANALKDRDVAQMSEAEIIDAIYEERSAKVVNKQGETVLKYFRSSTKSVQDSVEARFNQERFCAHQMLQTSA